MEPRAYILVVISFVSYTALVGLLVRLYERPGDRPDPPVTITRKLDEFGNQSKVEEFVKEIINAVGVEVKQLKFNVVNASFIYGSQSKDEDDYLLITMNFPKKVKWDFYGAIFYSLTVVTTIGYGQTSPVTKEGRLISSLYPIVGIPLLILTVSVIGEFMFGFTDRRFESLTKKSRKPRRYRRYFLIAQALILSVIGSCIFFLLPSILFSFMEEWSYLDAYYFAFMTLTTIGLGDLAAGYREDAPAWYRVFICLWIMLGMGWESMIITYLVTIFRLRAKHFMKGAKQGVTKFKRVVSKSRGLSRDSLKSLSKQASVEESQPHSSGDTDTCSPSIGFALGSPEGPPSSSGTCPNSPTSLKQHSNSETESNASMCSRLNAPAIRFTEDPDTFIYSC